MAVALGGCGGDDEPAATTKGPQLTVPGARDEPAPTATSGTTPPPATGTTSTSTTPAPVQTSTQPAPNTPEGRFEKFCRKNPGACG